VLARGRPVATASGKGCTAGEQLGTHVLAHGRPVATAAGNGCNAGEQLATHVLAMGTPLGCDLRRRTSCLPPHHCAAHPEPFSSVEVDILGPWGRGCCLDTIGPRTVRICLRVEGRGEARCGDPASPRPTDKDCNAGEQLATHVLAMGTPLGCDLRLCTTSLPPHHCAAHPEPFSSVEVDVLAVGTGLVWIHSGCGLCDSVFVWRGAVGRVRGMGRRSE
jgi:hypothetical protein